jgi:predicted ester cyclase
MPEEKEEAGREFTPARNKEIMLRFVEKVLDGGDIDSASEFIHENIVDHNRFPGQGPGLEGMMKVWKDMYKAFADVNASYRNVVAERDLVACVWTWSGTHVDEFMGIRPTGTKVTSKGIDITRLENGKAVERWGYSDEMGLMRQLGQIPGLGAPGLAD